MSEEEAAAEAPPAEEEAGLEEAAPTEEVCPAKIWPRTCWLDLVLS